jgi:TctA family transporter
MKLTFQNNNNKIKSTKPLILLSGLFFLLTIFLFLKEVKYFYIIIPFFLLSILLIYLRIKKNRRIKINDKIYASLFK